MKVYVTFWLDYDGEESLDKVFLNRDKARDYIEHKRNTTDFDYFFSEMEVSE